MSPSFSSPHPIPRPDYSRPRCSRKSTRVTDPRGGIRPYAYSGDSDGKTKPYLFHHDPLTSVTAVTGHNGGTTQSIKYSAFGQVQSSTGASPNRLKYTGREDDGTGLYYYRARYYDPSIGRFISEDPLGFEAGDVNLYAYVGNDPINHNDPTGEVALVGGAYGALAGGLGGFITAQATGQSRLETFQSVALGALVGFGVGMVNPALSNRAGAAAASFGLSRAVGTVPTAAIVGGASSAGGQLAGNVVPVFTGQPLGTNFSWGAVGGAAIGAPLATLPAKLVGNAAATTVGTSVPFGSRSLTIVTPTVQHTGSTFRALTEGAIGGAFEAGGQAIESMLFPPAPSRGASSGSQSLQSFEQLSSPSGAYGGFLLYPNKSNTNMMQSVYGK